MIGLLLIGQVPNASDKRGAALIFCPINRFSLRLENAKDVVRMVFDNIIIDTGPLRAALGARLNVNVRHALLSLFSFCWNKCKITRKLSFRYYSCMPLFVSPKRNGLRHVRPFAICEMVDQRRANLIS